MLSGKESWLSNHLPTHTLLGGIAQAKVLGLFRCHSVGELLWSQTLATIARRSRLESLSLKPTGFGVILES